MTESINVEGMKKCTHSNCTAVKKKDNMKKTGIK